MFAKWQDPSPKLRNGPILFHDVRYVKSDKNDAVRSRRSLEAGDMGFVIKRTVNQSLVLTSLEPGAIYEVSVRSSTEVGAGPWVHPPELIFTGKGKTAFYVNGP